MDDTASMPHKSRYLLGKLSGAPFFTTTRIFTGKEVTTIVRLISKPEPQYTEDAQKNQITGTVVLKCVFASNGTMDEYQDCFGATEWIDRKSDCGRAADQARACNQGQTSGLDVDASRVQLQLVLVVTRIRRVNADGGHCNQGASKDLPHNLTARAFL